MGDIYTKVLHSEYLTLIRKCETLEKEIAKLKAELSKATTKVKAEEKTAEVKAEKETKKGGNK